MFCDTPSGPIHCALWPDVAILGPNAQTSLLRVPDFQFFFNAKLPPSGSLCPVFDFSLATFSSDVACTQLMSHFPGIASASSLEPVRLADFFEL